MNVWERLDERLGRIEQTQVDIRIEVAKLKVKSSIWGAIAGTIPVLVVLLGYLLGK